MDGHGAPVERTCSFAALYTDLNRPGFCGDFRS
jgi:hypothetical protein